MINDKNNTKRRRRPTLPSQMLKGVTKVRKNYVAQAAIQTAAEFCKESSLHGCHLLLDNFEDTGNVYLRHIRRIFTFCVWMTAVSLGFGFGIYLILLVWNRYQVTPTITTIESNNYPIWNVAFPGVTICNVNTVYKPNTFNISHKLRDRGISSLSSRRFFQSLDALVTYEEVDSEFVRIFEALEKLGYTTERLMFDLAQPCEIMLKRCDWLGKTVPCKTLFRLVKSGGGFCCSFNYKALRSALEIHIRRIFTFCVWMTAVSLGFGFGIYLMLRVWNRYQVTPTITTIESNNYPIWNVAFPGVTICNVNTVYKTNIFNVSRKLKSRGFSALTVQHFLQSLDSLVTFEEVDSDFVKIFQTLETFGYTSESLMLDLAQPCEIMLKRCSWLGKVVPCKTLFRLAKSGGGFCCSFNYKALRSALEIETKVDDHYQINTPVIRISGAGEDVGLKVLLDVETNEYVAPKRFFYGAEVLIHDPEDFPEKSLLTAFGQPGLEVSMAVTPSVVVTEDTVESLPVNLRFCRFSYEKRLQITKKYSFQSCITECRAKTIIDKCGCLPFFYPPIDYYNTSANNRQCTLKDVKCLSDNKHVFASLQPPTDMYFAFNTTNIGMQCDCLPSCSEQNYDVETFISQRLNAVKAEHHFNDTDITNTTLIKVYFKDLSCIKYRRGIFMTWDDLLASFGGIFGLCLGGSVLSLVEIAYYATFKFYAKIMSNKAKLEKQKKQEVLINFNKIYLAPSVWKLKRNKEFLW